MPESPILGVPFVWYNTPMKLSRTEYNRQWRKNNPEKCREYERRKREKKLPAWRAKRARIAKRSYNKYDYQQKYRSRGKKLMKEYLEAHPCTDCGESNPWVLEFDHVRGEKKNDVGKLVCMGRAVATIEAEIAKCEVVCANCHKIRTYTRKGGRWTIEGEGPDLQVAIRYPVKVLRTPKL